MTDYGEEQRNELEALESIYPDSFTGDFGGWVGGRGRAALLPSRALDSVPSSLPAAFPAVLKSERPGGPAEALEPSRALWFRVTAATRDIPKHAETNSRSALSFARAAEGLFFLFSVLPSCGAAAG